MSQTEDQMSPNLVWLIEPGTKSPFFVSATSRLLSAFFTLFQSFSYCLSHVVSPLVLVLSRSSQGRAGGLRQQASGSEGNHSAAADWTPAALQQSGDGGSCQYRHRFTTGGQSWPTHACWHQVRLMRTLFFNLFLSWDNLKWPLLHTFL